MRNSHTNLDKAILTAKHAFKKVIKILRLLMISRLVTCDAQLSRIENIAHIHLL